MRPVLGERWRGKTALVTGASSGIGAAIALTLAGAGMRVALVARRQDRLCALAEQISAQEGSALIVPADLADESGLQHVFARVRGEYGDIDVLVNNAGFGWYGHFNEMSEETMREMLAVNVWAVVRLTHLFLPGMLARNTGHILNISSIAGEIPSQGIALYSATKACLNSFTTALHRELRGSGVHVSVVRPGPVKSEFFTTAATQTSGHPIPAERLAISSEAVVNCVCGLLRHPRRVAYVPRALRLVPWSELTLGWLMDRIGPALLSRLPRQSRSN